MKRKRQTFLVAAIAAAGICTAGSNPVSADLPMPDEIATKLGFPDSDKQKVLNGEFVSRNLESSNERELAVALAFYVPVPVADIKKQASDNVLEKTDPEEIAWADFSGAGSLDDFKSLDLAPDPEKRAKAYAKAKGGNDLNLSTAEIGEFAALDTADVPAITETVKKQLLARYQAYAQKGLAGITPYDRGGGDSTPAAGDLKSATNTLEIIKSSLPDFHAYLLNFPAGKPAGLDEEFQWSNYNAHGEPVFVLTHGMQTEDGDALVIVSRQFYVSGSYNVGQSVIGIMPVKGGSVVFYQNRTSTDQVAGFGSGTKKSMGGKVMASQLKKLYEKVRDNIEKSAK
jgi:hypothetical protein